MSTMLPHEKYTRARILTGREAVDLIREVLQTEIRMQIFVKLGLRTHESCDSPANRRVVLQTEN